MCEELNVEYISLIIGEHARYYQCPTCKQKGIFIFDVTDDEELVCSRCGQWVRMKK